MRKLCIFLGLIITVMVFAYCTGPKKSVGTTAMKANYQNTVSGILEASCTPCHFPAKGGNKLPLDSYTNIKNNIDDAIRRIELNPEDRGFMPFKHDKLPDSTIALIKQWKADGMPEN